MMYVGLDSDEDAKSLERKFFDMYPEYRLHWETVTFNTYYDKTLSQAHETVYVGGKQAVWASVLLNKTMLQERHLDIAGSLGSLWVPRCFQTGDFSTPCLTSLLSHLTLPKDDDAIDDTAVAKKFREADLHITTDQGINANGNLSWEESAEFIHDVVGPELYQYGAGSYYSESEYTLEDWKTRLWDLETYQRLLQIKQTWDPEHFFGCRHCIGDEEEPLPVSEQTLPSWRFQ